MVTWCQEAGASGTASTVSSAKVLHECRDFTEADPDPVSLGSAGLAMWDPRERGGDAIPDLGEGSGYLKLLAVLAWILLRQGCSHDSSRNLDVRVRYFGNIQGGYPMATPRNRGSSLRGKLLGLTLFSALVFLACGGIAYYAFFVTNAALREITESIVPRLALIDEVNTKVNAARRFEKEFFLLAGLDRKEGSPSEQAVAGHELLRDTYQEIGRKLVELQTLEGREAQNTGSYGFVDRSRDGRQFLKRIETAQLQALQRLTPLAEEVLGGRSFLEAGEAYGAYQEQAQDLEVGTLGFREKLFETLLNWLSLDSSVDRLSLSGKPCECWLSPLRCASPIG